VAKLIPTREGSNGLRQSVSQKVESQFDNKLTNDGKVDWLEPQFDGKPANDVNVSWLESWFEGTLMNDGNMGQLDTSSRCINTPAGDLHSPHTYQAD
jgi:hypothetical protein